MSLEAEINAALVAAAAVTALCPAARITWDRAPQGTSDPFVVLLRVSTVCTPTLGNGASGVTRLDNVTVQATPYARTVAEVLALAEAIRNALEALTSTTVCVMTDSGSAYNEAPDLHGRDLFFSCWHRSTTP